MGGIPAKSQSQMDGTPSFLMGDTPILLGVSCPRLDGGTPPIRTGKGYPLIRTGCGYLPLGLDGVHHHQDWKGYPQSGPDGYLPPRRDWMGVPLPPVMDWYLCRLSRRRTFLYWIYFWSRKLDDLLTLHSQTSLHLCMWSNLILLPFNPYVHLTV